MDESHIKSIKQKNSKQQFDSININIYLLLYFMLSICYIKYVIIY